MLACSATSYSDDAGKTYNPQQGCGAGTLLDHQTVGGGPFHAPAPTRASTAYPDAVYYCAQDGFRGSRARSDDGGVTFGRGTPAYNTPANAGPAGTVGGNCSAIHGHLRVGPDGTVYLPNKGCGGTPTPNNLTNSETPTAAPGTAPLPPRRAAPTCCSTRTVARCSSVRRRPPRRRPPPRPPRRRAVQRPPCRPRRHLSLTPPSNTRMFQRQRGCPDGLPSVLKVRSTLSLDVRHTAAARTYRFFGNSLPKRSSGLPVALYRVSPGGAEVLTARTRTDPRTGLWQITRTLTGTGRSRFLVRTPQDSANEAGASAVRTVRVR